LAASLWMLSPGPIFAGPYWGQVDAVGTVPFMLALVLAGRGRWSSAGALAGVALMVKPQFGLALVVVLAAAVVVWLRDADWRPSLRVLGASAGVVLLLGLPFRTGPAELIALVRSASETYPYTSLYAFNIWSIVGDFWKPDGRYVVTGALMLLGGIATACALTWRRRDVATLLAAGALAAFAFYFLPTRAHERYLFPAFALLLPLAAVRRHLLVPYVALALSFATSLYFAFTRYPQNDLRSSEWLEQTLFTRNGQIAVALVMLAVAAYLAWRLVRTDAILEPEGPRAGQGVAADMATTAPAAPVARGRQLPALLSLGGPPTRRDLAAALLIALVVLGTRGYRLDQPRGLYFDEVYHARTAFELLAQRDPYEWTHPHLAKEIMALGIVAFGGDRVVGAERTPVAPVAFTVTNDGQRVSADPQGRVYVVDRVGRGGLLTQALATPRALAATDGVLYVLTDVEVCSIGMPSPSELAVERARPFDRCVALPARGTSVGLVLAGGRVVVATSTAVYLYTTLAAPPTIVAQPALAVAAKPDASQIFVLQAGGVVRLIDPTSGNDSATLSAKGPATAIAYAQSANRIYLARADTPALDVIDIEGRSTDTVPLANGRTGAFASGATALAVVPRTQFLYALADARVVVVETHGASPYAAIPVARSDRFLGVDGEGDTLVVAGGDTAIRIETGRHALAWRLPGVLSAAILAFFLVLLARRLFASPLIAYLAGAAVVLDNSMFAQARIGMNDIYVTTCIVAAWYFIVAAHRPRRAAW
ncbi:MAG: phospholipid carrier-dependent glycosyltransferase, partial [Chloroflexota bacterium]